MKNLNLVVHRAFQSFRLIVPIIKNKDPYPRELTFKQGSSQKGLSPFGLEDIERK